MPDRPVKVIIDINLWISFLIGLKASPAIRSLLTDGRVNIVMTAMLENEIMTVADYIAYSVPLVSLYGTTHIAVRVPLALDKKTGRKSLGVSPLKHQKHRR